MQLADQLKLLNGELAQKKQKYTAEHPDIVTLQEKINALNKELKAVKNKPVDDYYKDQPDNPLYITIKSQLAGIESEISSIRKQREEVLDKIS